MSNRGWRKTQHYRLPTAQTTIKRDSKLGIPLSTVDTAQVSITIRSQQSRPSLRKPSMPKMPWETK